MKLFMRATYRTVRVDSILCFTSTTFFGAVLSGSLFTYRAVWLLLFAASSSAFGFVVNDLADADMDRSAGSLRNPVSTGELSVRRGALFSLFVLGVSAFSLAFLDLWSKVLGFGVLFLFFSYSWGIRAKARPVLDVIYHGGFLGLLAAIGYVEFRGIGVVPLLLGLTVFFLSGISEVLQEVRDYETDRRVVRTTATLLGKRNSLVLCLVFFGCACVACAPLLAWEVISTSLMWLSPLGLLLLIPIVQGARDERNTAKTLRAMRARRLIIVAAIVTMMYIKYVIG